MVGVLCCVAHQWHIRVTSRLSSSQQKRKRAGWPRTLIREWMRGTVCKNLSPLPLRTWVTRLPADSRCDLYLIWNQSILLAQEQWKLTCFGEEGKGSLLSLPYMTPRSVPSSLLASLRRVPNRCPMPGKHFALAREKLRFPRNWLFSLVKDAKPVVIRDGIGSSQLLLLNPSVMLSLPRRRLVQIEENPEYWGTECIEVMLWESLFSKDTPLWGWNAPPVMSSDSHCPFGREVDSRGWTHWSGKGPGEGDRGREEWSKREETPASTGWKGRRWQCFVPSSGHHAFL